MDMIVLNKAKYELVDTLEDIIKSYSDDGKAFHVMSNDIVDSEYGDLRRWHVYTILFGNKEDESDDCEVRKFAIESKLWTGNISVNKPYYRTFDKMPSINDIIDGLRVVFTEIIDEDEDGFTVEVTLENKYNIIERDDIISAPKQ